MCSNFGKPFGIFLWSGVKTLLLPTFAITACTFFLGESPVGGGIIRELVYLGWRTILYGGDFWFISAMFVARALYWIVDRISIKKDYIKFLWCVVFFIVGFMLQLNLSVQIYWYLNHALLLMPFIGIGQYFKKKGFPSWLRKTVWIYPLILMIVILLAYNGLLRRDYFYYVPGITFAFVNLNWSMLIPLLLLAIFGSMALISISKDLDKCAFLEYIGRNSLIVYCVQGFLLKHVYNITNFMLTDNNVFLSILCVIITFATVLLLFLLIIYILNIRYFRILIGKW